MEVSPSAPTLYRTAWRAVTCLALALILIQVSPAQTTRPRKTSKGPRAIGLLQLAANGKGHLVPVAILVDGEYYDASAYKADPVPMALESGTVYEAIATGVSQGLFTVAGAVQANHAWVGEGTWQAAGTAPPKKPAAPSRPPDEDVDAPPVLRRSGTTPRPPATPPEAKPPAPEPEKKAAAPPPDDAVEAAAPPEDADRPVLRRGKPEGPAKLSHEPEPATTKASAVTPPAKVPSPAIRMIPAISDSNVQEPRSFEYKMKAEEEEQFRKKMLAMATDEVNARVKTLEASGAEAPAPHSVKTKAAPKTAPTTFDDVQMRVFDLTSNNEPILVLSATAHPRAAKGPADLPFLVTLVARNNIYGELKKVSSSITDAQHLDVVPQMQLIDAVDADGDGHGELLFRRVSDTGNAYSIYRVIGTQLYPLFEGKIS